MSHKITRVYKAVNSKPLLKEVTAFIEEGLGEFGVQWDSEAQKETFVEIIEDFLAELLEVQGKIVSYKVMADRRNNKASDWEKGIYKFDVSYKQKNCLNTTQLLYTITETRNKDMLVLDFNL